MSRRNSLSIAPADEESPDSIAIETGSAVRMVMSHDKEVQCDFDEKGTNAVKIPSEGSLPTRSRLVILIICACMAIFLQALVSRRDINAGGRSAHNRFRRTPALSPQPYLALLNSFIQ